MSVKAVLVVTGIVQGVGYRWFVQRTARALGINGTVRNAEDGTVEIICEAPDKKRLQEFAEDIRRRGAWGPRVDGLKIGKFNGVVRAGFEIVY